MNLKNKYNILFFGFFLSIAACLFYLRPLNSPWFRIIGGDGLGYYSYLPARYIYHDTHYEFNWFDKAFNDNYAGGFARPTDNFMVQYKDKRINKYYPGLSLLWTPFFALGHLSAKLFHYKADGYSLPYQLCMALCSLCYLYLGLLYLRKLLQKWFHNELVATIIPMVIFYGTHLFNYSIFLNTQSHVYSFACVCAFLFYTYSYFNDDDKKTFHLLSSLIFLIILITVRPLNGLILLAVPAFVTPGFLKEKLRLSFQKKQWILIALALLFIINSSIILYTQTGTIIPYTYVNEKFYFNNPKLVDVLFSYHAGLFIYVPIAFMSLFGIFYLKNNMQKVLFPAILLLVLYLYSSWWYWPITTRAFIDFYPIMAIMLAALMHKAIEYKKIKVSFLVILFTLTAYHQLKSMQFRNGILDYNYTHSELYWRNFFKTHKANQYVIPPSSIIKQEVFTENFETNNYKGNKTDKILHNGSQATLLDKFHPFSELFNYKIPDYFKNKGVKKIRFSFWCHFVGKIKNAMVSFKFYDNENKLVFENPYYINSDYIHYNTWDYKEFGYELSDDELKSKHLDHMEVFIWNSESKGELYVDDVKTEFILTDKSFEIVQ